MNTRTRLAILLLANVPLMLWQCGRRTEKAGGRQECNEEKVLVISVQSVGGDLGGYSNLTITPDSIFLTAGIAAENLHDETAIPTDSGLWHQLVRSFTIEDFGQVASGHSEQPVDGVDAIYTLLTDKDSLSFMNAASEDPAFLKLARLTHLLDSVEGALPLTLSEPPPPKMPQILLPATYRTWNGENPVNALNGDWLGLYKADNHYLLKKASFQLEEGYDECSGLPTLTIRSVNSPLLFLEDIGIGEREVLPKYLRKQTVWPGEAPVSFDVYGWGEVLLSAKADRSDVEQMTTDEGDTVWLGLKDYKLYLKREGKPPLLLMQQANFIDTYPKLLLVADINGDNIPDFIIDTPRHYEEDRVLLLLSVSGGELKYQTAEIAVGFDC